MADLEEQETQAYFNDAFPDASEGPSSQLSHASLTNDDDIADIKISEDELEDIVEETQFDDLEYDTQAQDSFVPETQFDDLEMDTQATNGPDFATSNAGANTQFQLEGSSLFKRPELPDMNNAQNGFKFVPAKPRTQNPFKRPPVRHVGATVDTKASNMPQSEPELNRHSSDIDTHPRNTENVHTSTNPFPDASRPAAKPTIREPTVPTIRSFDQGAVLHSPIPNSSGTLKAPRQNRQKQSSYPMVAIDVQSAELTVDNRRCQDDELTFDDQPAQPTEDNRPNRASNDDQNAVNTEQAHLPTADKPKSSNSTESARTLQRNLSRGRQRIKKQPFPEATTPEESRRWSNKPAKKSDGVEVQREAHVRSGTPSNTGRDRLPVRDDSMDDKSPGSRQTSIPLNSRFGTAETGGNSSTMMKDEGNFPNGSLLKAASSTIFSSEGSSLAMSKFANQMSLESDASRHADPEQTSHASLPIGSQNLFTPSDTFLQTNILVQHTELNRANITSPGQFRQDTDQIASITRRPNTEQEGSFQDPIGIFETRLTSQTIPENQLRPQSQRSDRSNTITRPLSDRELTPAGSKIPRSDRAAKVKKASRTNKLDASNQSESSKEQNLRGVESWVQANEQSAQEILQSYKEQEDLIQSKQAEIEQQGACITAQKAEIERQTSQLQAQELQIKSLQKQMEKDKETLAPKYDKIMQQGYKYAKHANDLVAAQKWLKDAAFTIKKRTDEAFIAHQALVKRDEKTAKLQHALETSKSIRSMAENLETVKKEKKELIHVNYKLSTDEKGSREQLEALEKQFQELNAAHTKQSSEKTALEIEVEKLRLETKDVIKHNTLLEKTVNDRLLDLATERHNNEQLQKNLGEQTATWGKLIEIMKQVPTDTAEILNGHDSALAKLLSSKGRTQEKFEELASVIQEYVKREPELPPVVMKLVQDVTLRLESENQMSENNGANLKDAAISIAQELKESLGQLRLDKETEIRLNGKITELEHARESLSTLKIARDTEVENLSRQLEELRRELSNCRSELSNKNNELTSALNAPREDPALRGKISELEQAKAVLEQQVKNTSQEMLKVKEDLFSAQKIARSKEEEGRTLAEKLSTAQQIIKKFEESKAQALAQKDETQKKTCQEIVKNMETQKATIKLKLESEVKTYEQRVKNQLGEIKTLNEQLQRLERAAQNDGSTAENLAHKEQMKHLIAEWEQLHQTDRSTPDSNGVLSEMKSIQKKIKDLELLFQSAMVDSSEAIRIASKEQISLEELLRSFDATQQQILSTEQEARSIDFLQSQSNTQLGTERSQQRPRAPSQLRPTMLCETEDAMLLGDGMTNAPENSLRHISKKASSVQNRSPAGKQTTNGTNLTVDLASGPTILGRSPERHGYPRTSQNLLRQDFDSRGLGLTPRGTNWAPNSTRDGVRQAYSLLLEIDSPRSLSRDIGHGGYKPNAARFDNNVQISNQPMLGTHLQKEQGDERARDYDGLIPNEVKFANQDVLAKQAVHPGDEQVGLRPPRSIRGHNTAPTVAEESRSRRTSQQLKSALKKSTKNSTLSSEHNITIAADHGSARITRSNSGNKSQVNLHPLDNIRGLVSGRISSSRDAPAPQAAGVPNQDTPKSSHSFDPRQSPPMDAPTRNRNKRPATTVLESSKPKAARLRQPSSQIVIPDSQ